MELPQFIANVSTLMDDSGKSMHHLVLAAAASYLSLTKKWWQKCHPALKYV